MGTLPSETHTSTPQNGAPLRGRFETKLGFTLVKFVRRIEVADDDRKVGDGIGGVGEDEQ